MQLNVSNPEYSQICGLGFANCGGGQSQVLKSGELVRSLGWHGVERDKFQLQGTTNRGL